MLCIWQDGDRRRVDDDPLEPACGLFDKLAHAVRRQTRQRIHTTFTRRQNGEVWRYLDRRQWLRLGEAMRQAADITHPKNLMHRWTMQVCIDHEHAAAVGIAECQR